MEKNYEIIDIVIDIQMHTFGLQLFQADDELHFQYLLGSNKLDLIIIEDKFLQPSAEFFLKEVRNSDNGENQETPILIVSNTLTGIKAANVYVIKLSNLSAAITKLIFTDTDS